MPFPKRDAVLFRQQQYVTRFNYTLGALAVLAIAILAAVCRVQFQEQPRVWFLVAVAVASAGVGSLAGFLFATFGDETKTFAPTLTVLNGLVGGFAIADLSKDESIVRRFFISIAATASLPGGGGMVGLLAMGAALFQRWWIRWGEDERVDVDTYLTLRRVGRREEGVAIRGRR
ncbi:MAG: hypothetical protein IT186_09630, partial [Acidobacteria bacterium]|nr:hypothetical protein [Acidobacteriota bacterium]